MANSPQAKKRARQNARRQEINKARRSRIRTHLRKVEEAIASGDKDAATAALREAFREIVADPEFQAEATKVVGNELTYVSFDQAKGALDQLRSIDPAVAAFWKERADKLVQ